MNIKNLRAVVGALEKEGVVLNPSKAFTVRPGQPLVGGGHYVYYANTTIEACLKTLANELSLVFALEQINWDILGSENEANRKKEVAVRVLKEQLVAAEAFLKQ